MKQKMYQQFVYKVESGRILALPDRNLIITPQEARLNDEMISLADSAVLREIDRLNGVDREATAERIKNIREEISRLKNSDGDKIRKRRRVRELYSQLDDIQLKCDYLPVVMNKPSDFDKLNEGFSVNGIEYKRLVGTPNGVKKSTVVYCPVINQSGVRIHELLDVMMNGGRNKIQELVPAKFEAYKALACSASVPLSEPRGVLVVPDFVLKVKGDYIQLENRDDADEPVMTEKNGEVELNASDGYGLICPELAERWSGELGLDYTASGMCIRDLFCKGMVYTFDFHEFARRFSENGIVVDAWGTPRSIYDVEIVLPVSVEKLWNAYGSLEKYLDACRMYHHGFAATKVCEKELENERTLNYQFIQSYDLSDDDIRELVQPSIDEIKETIAGDEDKTLLYLRGACGKRYVFEKEENYLAKAIMADRRVAKDPYVTSVVHSMIKKRIDDLKIGAVKVHGNYTVISCDPFAFCQSIFGCDVPDEEKGLLKAGEMYSKYWTGDVTKRVICFRAPMSCHNNIKAMNVVRNEDIDYWYRFMTTVNIINCHDMFYPAENGADNDGDAVLVTDNKILLAKTRDTPAIICVQRKAGKSVITEEKLAAANKNSFGDEIGAITNRVTSMYDVMASFSKGSPQYKTLEYRVKCGQLLQQDAVDAAKGIISKPMPKEWYNIHSLKILDDDLDLVVKHKTYNKQIVADKKPYFMTYIYPELRREENSFVKTVKSKCEMMFGISLDVLLASAKHTEEEQNFIEWYYKKLPVSDGGCVMNRLCHYVEREFDGYLKKVKGGGFPYTELYSSGENCEPGTGEYKKIGELYQEYLKKMRELSVMSAKKRLDSEAVVSEKMMLAEEFRRECDTECPDEKMLCDILLSLCYKNDSSKKFVWDMCGETIVKNILSKNGGEYSYYVMDDEGEIVYRGEKYKKVFGRIEVLK